MIKIAIANKLLYIADQISFSHLNFSAKKTIQYIYDSSLNIKKVVNGISSSEFKYHHILTDRPNMVLDKLFHIYNKIEAAGGLVQNERGQFLMIRRNNKWDLPKGKAEKGETPELTAIREVEEECGLIINGLHKSLTTTFHSYDIEKKKVIKVNYWFLMSASSNQPLKAQEEEGIDQVIWMNMDEVKNALKDSYEAIKDVFNAYLESTFHNIQPSL